MTVDILGTTYAVTVKKYDEDESFARCCINGYCDAALHEIVVCDMTTYKDYEHETQEHCAAVQRACLRHEIVHAFFNESGLQASTDGVTGSWAHHEEMVDWIALQGAKIYKAWKEAGAL